MNWDSEKKCSANCLPIMEKNVLQNLSLWKMNAYKNTAGFKILEICIFAPINNNEAHERSKSANRSEGKVVDVEYIKWYGVNGNRIRALTLQMPHGTIKFYIIIHSHSELLNPNDLKYCVLAMATIVQRYIRHIF